MTARPAALPTRRISAEHDEDEVPTRIFEATEVYASGTAPIVANDADGGRVVPEPEPEEESTCILDDAMLEALEAEGGGEPLEPSHSGACSRRPPRPGIESASHNAYAGRDFGGYRIVRTIAAGGMASVLLGRKQGAGGFTQHAAIKVVHDHFATERDFVDMFLDEARIASRIRHPNVVGVLDFGNAEGTYFLALEYVHGETWGKLLGKLRRSADRDEISAIAAYVVAQAAEGLHAAHTAVDEEGRPLHIVHRDISPDNLLVGYDGTVRLLDFGVAHAEARLTNTRAGIVKGRLAYMAPEQARGQRLDARADIWSLGVLLREALEQKRLFRRDTEAHTILAVTDEPLPEWKPGVPEELRAVADRALTRDPAQRFATARELARALQQYLRHQPQALGMPELGEHMQRLFEDAQREKQAWVREPLPENPEPAAPARSEQRALDPNPSGTRPLPPPEPVAPDVTPCTQAVLVAPRPAVDRSSWIALAVACLALAVVMGMWLTRLYGRPDVQAPKGAPASAGPASSPASPHP